MVMAHYLSPDTLAQLVKDAQAARTMTPALYKAIRLMTFRCGGDEDIVQEVAIDIWKHLHSLDPARNVFAYITQCINLEKWNSQRRTTNARKLGSERLDEERFDLLK